MVEPSQGSRWRRWNTADEQTHEEETSRKQEGHPADVAPKEPDPIALRDQQIAELTDALRRLQAEFQNYKKRQEKDCT